MKQKFYEAANSSEYGGFVRGSSEGEWVLASNPKAFKSYLENIGFEVVKCEETAYSTAIAETACGLRIAYNGHCSNIAK